MTPSDPTPPATFAPGDWVAVDGLHGAARVIDVDVRRGRVRVELRERQWNVPAAKLTPAPPDDRDRPTGPAVRLTGGGPVYYEVDLHGRRVEEALELAERGLDQAVVNRLDRFKIVHGHGSGRVRAAVRKMLDTHPYVDSYRFGEPQEGGLACTVAIIRRPS
jgi:DNA mismatch repair protein MutS2